MRISQTGRRARAWLTSIVIAAAFLHANAAVGDTGTGIFGHRYSYAVPYFHVGRTTTSDKVSAGVGAMWVLDDWAVGVDIAAEGREENTHSIIIGGAEHPTERTESTALSLNVTAGRKIPIGSIHVIPYALVGVKRVATKCTGIWIKTLGEDEGWSHNCYNAASTDEGRTRQKASSSWRLNVGGGIAVAYKYAVLGARVTSASRGVMAGLRW